MKREVRKATDKEKRTFIIICSIMVVVGIAYFVWGFYNASNQVYETGFVRSGVDRQLNADAGWAMDEEEASQYERLTTRRDDWLAAVEAETGEYTPSIAGDDCGTLDYSFYDNGSDTTVVLLHAYNRTAEDAAVFAPYWWARGYNVLLPQLRGHGDTVSATSFGWYESRDVADLLFQSGLAGQRIVLHGSGMGAAAALWLATNEDVDIALVVADSAYSSLKEIALYQLKRQFSFSEFPYYTFLNMIVKARLDFSMDEADLTAAVAASKAPTLFICGDADEFVPPAMTEALYSAAAEERRQLAVLGAGHGLTYSAGTAEYERALDEACAQWLD